VLDIQAGRKAGGGGAGDSLCNTVCEDGRGRREVGRGDENPLFFSLGAARKLIIIRKEDNHAGGMTGSSHSPSSLEQLSPSCSADQRIT
jgi:hypothetical protein